MIHSSRFSALLDANVLYPAPVRDLLLHLANVDLYKPRWTDKIQEEWMRNLLKNRKDITSDKLLQTKFAMNMAFPDANVQHYETLMTGLALPDENDRHILAAAIKCNADVIVTFNIRDFPLPSIKKFEIEVQHPDTFVMNIIDLDEPTALDAFKNQVANLKNPPKSNIEVLSLLTRIGLPKSAARFKELF